MKRLLKIFILFLIAMATPVQSMPKPTQSDPITVKEMIIEPMKAMGTFHPFLNNKVELVALCYHHFNTGGILSVSESQLSNQLREFSEKGYIFVDASDLARYHKTLELPPEKMVFVSFDDGYVDVLNAIPVLDKYGAKATFFVSSGKTGEKGYLSKDQIKEIVAHGFAIGSHTVTHADLTAVSMDVVEQELAKSKETLEQITGGKIETIAYPCGEISDGVIEITKKYYTLGFLATHADDSNGESPYRIYRWGVFDYNDDLVSIKKNPQDGS